jgi:hypothetical protein
MYASSLYIPFERVFDAVHVYEQLEMLKSEKISYMFIAEKYRGWSPHSSPS